ncbi:restriction endonuclease [Kitasatospora purpeofusca]|uniref:restriction endonuclease n=1 Tax=Kitasatospora purpeofusca TaxID=67352 RepID=UPI003F4ADE66
MGRLVEESAGDPGSEGPAVGPDAGRWALCRTDPNLREPPASDGPGNCAPGEDLDLAIGWDRFENLLLAVVSGVRGFRGVKFRRYGVQGQAQHGIDLAGREPDGDYTVVQCKDYRRFTASDLRAAVELFARGTRPFGAERLIVATSAATQSTQIADELAVLQDEYPALRRHLIWIVVGCK